MSTIKTSKTIRQLKERAAEIRRQSKISIPRSLDLAAREHGFESFEQARSEISTQRAGLLNDSAEVESLTHHESSAATESSTSPA